MQNGKKIFVTSVISVLTGVIIGIILAANFDWIATLHGHEIQMKNTRIGEISSSLEKNTHSETVYLSIHRNVAQKIIPKVVSIKCSKIITEKDLDKLKNENRYFDDNRSKNFRLEVPRKYKQKGFGSGIILSPDGYIVTNVHLVEMANEIIVTLQDNKSFHAKVIGLDRLTEIAIIKIEARNLPYARLGNSDSSKVGDWVLAIGNPLNLRFTVTAGIISAKGRQIDVIQDNYAIESFIQTDAALNPGSSGGALVNMKGEVIGVNTAIATETGFDMGFAFAIPINLVKMVSADLIRQGKVVRAYLGIAMQNINETEARALGLKKPSGVFVDDVFAGSPAEKAGIKPIDIIKSINGQVVNRANQLQALIAKLKPNTRTNIVLLRDGVERKATISLGAKEQSYFNHEKKEVLKYIYAGLKVSDLTEFDKIELGIEKNQGVLIKNIDGGSPAEKSGLQVDDLLVAINRNTIHDVEEFVHVFKGLHSRSVAIFKVFRNGGNYHHFVEINE